jgi:hypothetical protein
VPAEARCLNRLLVACSNEHHRMTEGGGGHGSRMHAAANASTHQHIYWGGSWAHGLSKACTWYLSQLICSVPTVCAKTETLVDKLPLMITLATAEVGIPGSCTTYMTYLPKGASSTPPLTLQAGHHPAVVYV